MIKLAVLCPAEIAKRRFMPSLALCPSFSFLGVGAHRREKAEEFLREYPGRLFETYEDVLSCDEVDAVYIPLPPALHYEWAKKALEKGKHVLLEKPFAATLSDAEDLIRLAEEKNLALHENYMFVFHDQIREIHKLLSDGAIGDIRLMQMSFGFPMRPAGDFRYEKKLGGGAFLDAGGYCLKAAGLMLGETASVTAATVNYTPDFDVELDGSATVVNEEGLTAQLSFGMDNNYRCSLEVWGSKGTLSTNRFFTAPSGFSPSLLIERNGAREELQLPADDTFRKSIEYFQKCIEDPETRKESHHAIFKQAGLMEEFRWLSGLDS